VVDEHRPRERRLDVVKAELAEGRAGSARELLDHDVDRLPEPRHDRSTRLHARLAVVVDERVRVRVRQREAPLVRCQGRVVDVHDPRHGLLLEPLTGVALGDPGGTGQVGRRGRPGSGQRLVEAQAHPQLHVGQLHRGEARHEEAARELLDAPGVLGRQLHRCHASPSIDPADPGAMSVGTQAPRCRVTISESVPDSRPPVQAAA
jgi:hypothetical protein